MYRRFHKRFGTAGLVVSVIALAFAMIGVPSASAAEHPLLGTFGSANQPSFITPRGIAVDQSTGDVLVIDSGAVPKKVSRWTHDGSPANFSALGSNVIDGKGGADKVTIGAEEVIGGSAGAWEVEVAVAPAGSAGGTAGDIYVTDSAKGAVDIFATTGAYLGELTLEGSGSHEATGVTVDSAGAVYVSDYWTGVHKYVPTANPVTNAMETATFAGVATPSTLAAGTGPTAGYIFAHPFEGTGVEKVNSSTGLVQYAFGGSLHYPAVAVDPTDGHVYLAEEPTGFVEYNASGASAPAAPVSETPAAGAGQGIAVDGASGDVYVSFTGSTKLAVYGPLNRPLTVIMGGNGEGTVVSNPAGIECLPGEEECVELFEVGAEVELEAEAEPGSVFAGWVGCQHISATTCKVKVTETKEVTAVFLKEAENPVVVTLPVGNAHCPNGGLEVKVGATTSYLCNGAKGSNGATGPVGPQGPQGARGPAGPTGKIVCKAKLKGKKVKVTCKIKASASSSSLRWRLMRGGHVVRHGATTSGRLRLNHLRRGRYVLRVQDHRKGTVIVVS